MFGMSNVIWGLIFYLGLTVLSSATSVVGRKKLVRVKQLRAGLIGIGFLYSIYLVYVQLVQIGEYCKLCLISAGIVVALFALQVIDYRTPTGGDRPAEPEPAGRRRRLFAGLAIATVVLAGADVLYFRSLPPIEAAPVAATPAVQESAGAGGQSADCQYDLDRPMVENYRDLVTFTDPSKGNPDASVTVIEFFDPNCPHCATLHPIMEQVVARHGDKAWFVWRPFLNWPASMTQIEALYFAAQDGKFFEMMEEQFRRQSPQPIGVDELGEIATLIGLDGDLMRTRLQRGLYQNIIMRQRQAGVEAGIRAVPAVMINGRFVRSRSGECIGQLIEEAAAE
jgi:protein-disulfide isomerase